MNEQTDQINEFGHSKDQEEARYNNPGIGHDSNNPGLVVVANYAAMGLDVSLFFSFAFCQPAAWHVFPCVPEFSLGY